MFTILFTKTPLLFLVQSFWRDEAFTWLLAKQNIFDLFVYTAKDFNPPLYYLIIHYWIKFFGSSEISLRTVSFIFYWATIYCVYLFLIHIFKIAHKRTWLYIVLVAVNPILLYYAFEARMYTMLAFFSTLSFYSFLKQNNKIFFIAVVLGLYTHYFMVFVLAAILLYRYFTQEKKYLKKLLMQFSAPLFVFIPWLLFVLKVKDFSSQSFWIEKSTITTLSQLTTTLYTGYENSYQIYGNLISGISLGATFLIGCMIAYVLKRKFVKNKLLVLLIVWSFGIPIFAILVSFVKPIFFPRYFIFSTVGLLLLIFCLLEYIPVRVRIGILCVLFIATFGFLKLQLKYKQKSDLRKIFREIKYLSKPYDVVYVTTELDYFTAQYYFDENRVYVYGKTSEEIPTYVGKVLIPKEKFASSLPIYQKKAFILTSDSHYEIQAAR